MIKMKEKIKKGYLVITKENGKYFPYYSKKLKSRFYSHIEPTFKKAIESINKFRKQGVYAKIIKYNKLK